MNDDSMRYLRAINRQFAGPLRQLASDRLSTHAIHVTHGVLSRVVAEMELAAPRWVALQTACRGWCNELLSMLPATDDCLRIADAINTLCSQSQRDATREVEAELVKLLALLSKRDGTEPQRLIADIVSQDWQHLKSIEARCVELQTPSATASAAQRGVLDDAQQQVLVRLLQQQCGESQNLKVTNVTPLSGGFSKQTILVDIENAIRIPSQLVLRLDRPESPTGTSVAGEFPLLQILYAEGVRVPQPWMLDTGQITGTPVMVVSRSPGRVIADGHHFHEATDGLANCAISLGQELAKLHRIPLERLPKSVQGQDISNVDAMRNELDRFHQIWKQSAHSSIAVEAAFNWLYGNLDAVGEEKTLTHGDIRFHNTMCDADGVTAILDWELAAVQNPALDLGYCYHHVRQLVDWPVFLEAYRNAGGNVPPARSLAFYALRTELLTASFLTKIESGFLAAENGMIDLAYAGTQLRQHNVYLLADRLQKILSGADL